MDDFNTVGLLFLIPEAAAIVFACWYIGKEAEKNGKSRKNFSVITAITCMVFAAVGWTIISLLGGQYFYKSVLSFVFAAIGGILTLLYVRDELNLKTKNSVEEPKILVVKPEAAALDAEAIAAARKKEEENKNFYIKGGNYKNCFISEKYPNAKKNFFARNIYVVLGFLFPAILMTIAFARHGVGPFGTNQILQVDAWHQYYPFLVDLQHKLQTGGSLLWSWNIGGGTNYLALMSYYTASPLNFLSVFVPQEFLREFFMFEVVTKIAFAGGSFALMLRYIYKKNDLSISFFGMLFALSAFFMGYYWNTMWLDTAAIAPLVIMGVYKLMREGKFLLYVFSLAVAIMANYYIGLFICYFTLLMYIIYAVCNWQGIKNFVTNTLRMGVYTVLSLFITACLTIPAFLGLQNTYSTNGSFPTQFAINQFGDTTATADLDGVFSLFGRALSNTLSFVAPNKVASEGIPNIACSIFAILLAIVFFTSNKFKLKEKIANGALLSFIILSCIIRQLEYIWNGFHFTNMIPYRFSFLFSFVLVMLAFRAYHVLSKKTRWDIIVALIFISVIFIFANGVQSEDAVMGSLVLIALFATLFIIHSIKPFKRVYLNLIVCVILLVEMFMTTYLGVETVGVNSMNGYPMEKDNMQKAIEMMYERESNKTDIWRAEATRTQSVNDGSLNQYPGLTVFSSMANVNMTYFTQNFGFSSWPGGNRYAYYEGSPVSNLFFNVKYQLARNGKYNNTLYLEEIFTGSDGGLGLVKLLHNKAYLPMGFLVNDEIYDLAETPRTVDGVNNPFDVQNDFFRAATGIQEDVYTRVEVSEIENLTEGLTINESDYGKYSFSAPSAGTQLRFKYEIPEDGLYCSYMQTPKGELMYALCNDVAVEGDYIIGRANIVVTGQFKKGDIVTLYTNAVEGATAGSMQVYFNLLNSEVFEEGIAILGESSLKATYRDDTHLSGKITANRDGVFYTSIPYEKGWSVKVDGVELKTEAEIRKERGISDDVALAAEDGMIKPVGDALLAFPLSEGEHTIEISYIPDGFIPGMAITIFGVFAIAALAVLRWKFKDKMLFKVFVKRKKSDADDSDTENELEEEAVAEIAEQEQA